MKRREMDILNNTLHQISTHQRQLRFQIQQHEIKIKKGFYFISILFNYEEN